MISYQSLLLSVVTLTTSNQMQYIHNASSHWLVPHLLKAQQFVHKNKVHMLQNRILKYFEFKKGSRDQHEK